MGGRIGLGGLGGTDVYGVGFRVRVLVGDGTSYGTIAGVGMVILGAIFRARHHVPI